MIYNWPTWRWLEARRHPPRRLDICLSRSFSLILILRDSLNIKIVAMARKISLPDEILHEYDLYKGVNQSIPFMA